MKTNSIYTIALFLLGMMMTACGGSSDGDNPAPAAVLEQVLDSDWTLSTAQDAAGTDVKATFYVQSFKPATDNTLTGTIYPNNEAKTGTWSGTVNSLTLTLGGEVQLTNMSLSGNTLSADVSIASGVGGKTATFSGKVSFTK